MCSSTTVVADRRNSIMKFISTHVRLLEDQYNWLRRHCFDTGISQAEAIRLALELYRATVVEEKKNFDGKEKKKNENI
jgi:hypothetical protein